MVRIFTDYFGIIPKYYFGITPTNSNINTGYTSTTTSTTVNSINTNQTIYADSNNTYYITSTDTLSVEDYEKIKSIIHKELISNMKSTWTKYKKEYKKVPKKKHVHQLHNICFNGRGWA